VSAERVRRVADRLGYRPNPLAQRLRKGKLDAVGLIAPGDLRPFGDAFFVDQVTSLSSALAAPGLDLMLVAERGEAELVALQRLVEGRRVDGVIVARTLRHDPRVDYLLKQGLPFVCHGRTETPDGYAFVDMDGDRVAKRQKIALYEPDMLPPGDNQFVPVKLERKEAIRRGERAESPAEARVRIGGAP